MPAMPASTYSHSSEIRDLRSTQFSRETLICHIFVIRKHCTTLQNLQREQKQLSNSIKDLAH